MDEGKRELWTKIAKGTSIMIRIPSDKGIAGSVATSGQSLRIDEAYADPRFSKEIDKLNNYRTKTILCVPIKDTSSDKVIGVCQAINKEVGLFNADDEGVFSILAQQAGLILKSSIKYNQTITNQTKTKRIISVFFSFNKNKQDRCRYS